MGSGKHDGGRALAVGARLRVWIATVAAVAVVVLMVIGLTMFQRGADGNGAGNTPEAGSSGLVSQSTAAPSVTSPAPGQQQSGSDASQPAGTASDSPSDGDASVDFDSVPETSVQ